MTDEFCECSQHGEQPITFVCKHITATPRPNTIGFVSYLSEGEDDLRDAWCEECDAYLDQHGGHWIEGRVEVPDGINILCAECYRLREEDALREDRRMIRHE
ncbi:hypothetical protein ASE85_03665 [Sphingobium sp. Leaf26]|uniref:hypothetical protein n=1 Tax=Sphingobium sp. Leaf26 TaxID=1735693 RepID=UPI0006FACF90|nr:hypothetical protein [Sphingobium sp. Leaf26]KQN10035.1 hypothetical protein ASE85_03665 [Sphingobium sp. Leaf26]